MDGLDYPVVCPSLIGRDEALRGIESFLRHASSLQVTTLLISGEAGIGKSRLVAEASERPGMAGVTVLELACFETAGRRPYGPVIELLSRLVGKDAAFETHIRPYASDLASLLPASVADDGASAQSVVPESERLHAALRGLFASIAGTAPGVVVVEDVHWSDASTLELLLYLARAARESGLRLLLTLRPDEGSPEVRSFLASLERERLASELRLSPLTLTETDTMLRAIFQTSRSTRIELLHGLFALTNGNPFFIEEMLRSLLADAPVRDFAAVTLDHPRVPRTVQEAVSRRVELLSEPARRVLELAAVMGVRVDLTLLQAIAGMEETSLLRSLRELVQCQLLVEAEQDAFAFRHALTREAVTAGLLSREKALLHGQIARQIEADAGSADAGTRLEDLSYHFYEAGDWAKALRYSEQAGHRALAIYAPVIALEHFNRAVQAAEHLQHAPSASVYRGRAIAFEALGDLERSRSDFERAVAATEAAGDVPGLVECLLGLGLLWASRDYSRSILYYQRAVELSRGLKDRHYLAHALSRLGNGNANTGDFDAALAHLTEALAIFREVVDERGVAETLDLIGMTGLTSARFAESLQAYKEAIELLGALDDRRSRISALASLPALTGTYQTCMLAPALSLLDATPYADEALQAARELNLPSDLSYTLWQRACWLGSQGRYREAFAAANEALRLAEETEHTQWQAAALCSLAAIHIDVLRFEEAESHLRRALPLSDAMGSPLWQAQAASFMVDTLLAARKTDEAAVLVAPRLENPVEAPASLMDVWWLMAASEVAFATGDYAKARRIISAISASRPPGLRLKRLLGRMAATQGASDEAFALLQDAAIEAERQGNRALQWRLRCDLAQVHFAAGDRESARTEAAEALRLIDALAEELDDPEAYRGRAALLLPPPLRQRANRARDSVLTGRETEIAHLILQGMTNREIAERLVLSSRTVETHIANAMAKLGVGTRAQLAAWLIEHPANAP